MYSRLQFYYSAKALFQPFRELIENLGAVASGLLCVILSEKLEVILLEWYHATIRCELKLRSSMCDLERCVFRSALWSRTSFGKRWMTSDSVLRSSAVPRYFELHISDSPFGARPRRLRPTTSLYLNVVKSSLPGKLVLWSLGFPTVSRSLPRGGIWL